MSAQRRPPDGLQEFLGSLLIAVGAMFLLLSGLCGVAVGLLVMAYPSDMASRNSWVSSLTPGGVQLVAGIALFVLGRWIRRGGRSLADSGGDPSLLRPAEAIEQLFGGVFMAVGAVIAGGLAIIGLPAILTSVPALGAPSSASGGPSADSLKMVAWSCLFFGAPFFAGVVIFLVGLGLFRGRLR
jgi:hypothetical protein